MSLSSQVETPGLAAASSMSSTSATTRFASRSLAISAGLLSWMDIRISPSAQEDGRVDAAEYLIHVPVRVNLTHGPLGLFEVVEHRPGLGVVLAQAVANDLLGIVAALDERAAVAIANAGAARRLGDDVIRGLAALAGAPARDAHHQLLVGDIEHEHVVQLLSLLAQQPAETLRLGNGAGEPVEQETALGVRLGEPLCDEVQYQLVRDELALVDELFGAASERCVRLDGRAQHVAGRDVRDLEYGGQSHRLRPLARPRGSKQQ